MRLRGVAARVHEAAERDSGQDTFLRVLKLLAPSGLQNTLLRLAQNWADRLGGVVAVDGRVLRQSFDVKGRTVTADACTRSAAAAIVASDALALKRN